MRRAAAELFVFEAGKLLGPSILLGRIEQFDPRLVAVAKAAMEAAIPPAALPPVGMPGRL